MPIPLWFQTAVRPAPSSGEVGTPREACDFRKSWETDPYARALPPFGGNARHTQGREGGKCICAHCALASLDAAAGGLDIARVETDAETRKRSRIAALNAHEFDALASEEARNPTDQPTMLRARYFKPVKDPLPRRSEEEARLLTEWLAGNRPAQVAPRGPKESHKRTVGAIL